MSNMKVGFYESETYGELDIFFDKDNNIIGVNNTNDADWRHEYFNPVLEKVGLKVKHVDVYDFKEDVNLKLKTWFGF